MMRKATLVTFGLNLCLASFVSPSFALSADTHFYVKGIADDDGPFAGQYVRILGNEHKGTILFTNANGLGIVRLNLSDTVECYNFTSKICMTGIVTATKNFGRIDVGDVLRLALDPQGKKQTVSFLDGERVSSTLSVSHDSKPQSKNMSDMTGQRFVFFPEQKDHPTRFSMYQDDKMSDAIAMARQFTETHPTFMYDGIPESLNLSVVSIIDGKTPVYIVQANFDSAHSGYGDRTGQVLAQQITPHTMRIMVSDLGLGSAIIDGVWDEFNQNWQK